MFKRRRCLVITFSESMTGGAQESDKGKDLILQKVDWPPKKIQIQKYTVFSS